MLEQRNVLNMVFESVPSILILVNSAGRVDDINRVGIEFANRKKERLINLLEGDVFGCVNSFKGEGCGRNVECTQCPVRSGVMRTFSTGESIYNEEGSLTVRRGDKVKTIDFLTSTILMKRKNTEQVLVAITDITPLKEAEQERDGLRGRSPQA